MFLDFRIPSPHFKMQFKFERIASILLLFVAPTIAKSCTSLDYIVLLHQDKN